MPPTRLVKLRILFLLLKVWVVFLKKQKLFVLSHLYYRILNNPSGLRISVYILFFLKERKRKKSSPPILLFEYDLHDWREDGRVQHEEFCCQMDSSLLFFFSFYFF